MLLQKQKVSQNKTKLTKDDNSMKAKNGLAFEFVTTTNQEILKLDNLLRKL
jgi:hypothetical protein